MTKDELAQLHRLHDASLWGDPEWARYAELMPKALMVLDHHILGMTKAEIDRRATESAFNALRLYSDEMRALKDALQRALERIAELERLGQ